MKNPVFDPAKDLTIYYAETNKPHKMTRRHYHDKYEIFFMLEGERYLYFDNKKFHVKKGDLFIIEPFIPHLTECTDVPDMKRYIMSIKPEIFSLMLTKEEIEKLFKPFSTCVISLEGKSLETVSFYLNEFLRLCLLKRDSITRKLMFMTAIQLVEFLGRELKHRSHIKIEAPTKKNELPIMNTLKYINLHYTEALTLDFLSSYAHMSKSNFCLVFKKVTGETFVDYLNTLRIAQVHRLLLETTLSLGAIAEQTGFSSVDYMTRTFKKVHGISPTELRKKADELPPAPL